MPRVSIGMQKEAEQRSMMPETRDKFNQYLLATSETEEKVTEIQQGEEGKALNQLKSGCQGKAYDAYSIQV